MIIDLVLLVGLVFTDINNDGIKQAHEPLLAHAYVEAISTNDLPVHLDTFTGSDGQFRFLLPQGRYELSIGIEGCRHIIDAPGNYLIACPGGSTIFLPFISR